MSEEKGNFVGAHVPDHLAAQLALAAVAFDRSRSSLIRSALEDYLKRLGRQRTKRGVLSLADRISARMVAEWNKLKASSAEPPRKIVGGFIVHSRKELAEAGIRESVVDDIIKKLTDGIRAEAE